MATKKGGFNLELDKTKEHLESLSYVCSPCVGENLP